MKKYLHILCVGCIQYIVRRGNQSGWAYVGKESREGLYKDTITVWVVV